MSNRRERFVDLAEKRVLRTIKDIRLIGNLANRSNYDYEPKDADTITKTLEQELKDLRKRFAAGGATEEVSFTLR